MWYPITQLLHWYLYSEVTVLLLWGNSAVTMEYPHIYSVGVPAWVLQGSIGATSEKQNCYFQCRYQCSNCVIGYHIAGHSNLAVYIVVSGIFDVAENPMKIGLTHSTDTSIWRFCNTKENKRHFPFGFSKSLLISSHMVMQFWILLEKVWQFWPAVFSQHLWAEGKIFSLHLHSHSLAGMWKRRGYKSIELDSYSRPVF